MGSNKPRPVADRLWERVDKNGPVPAHAPGLGPCWVWTGHRMRGHGYGRIFVPERGRQIGAHIVGWMLANGSVPNGLFVCHRCDNPPCVNPSHLFLGTRTDNATDMVLKGRHASSKRTHCPSGHEYPPANVGSVGLERRCLACNRKWDLERYAKVREALRPSITHVCLFCGKRWTPEEGQALRKRRYCSDSCAELGAIKIRRADQTEAKLWRGLRRPRAEYFHEGRRYVAVLVLVPWHPLRTARHDLGGVEIYRLEDSGAEVLVGYAHDLAGSSRADCKTQEKEDRMETCATCDGSGAVDAVVNGVRGQDACPACDGTGTRRPAANDAVPPRLAPLVSAPPTMSLSAAVAACVASSYGRVRPRLVDPDEVTAVTVVARLAGGAR